MQTELLEVFAPLLCEMEEINTTLDRDEFIDASYRLFNVHIYLNIKSHIDFKRTLEELDTIIQKDP